MCREEVCVQDAVVAVTVVECSMQGSALLGGINVLHSAFPGDADSEHALQGKQIIKMSRIWVSSALSHCVSKFTKFV